MKILLPGDVHFSPWQAVEVGFNPRDCMVFDADGLRISAETDVPHAH